MAYRIHNTCKNINWDAVSQVIQEAGLAIHPAELRKKAFENSYRVVFVFDDELLIGVGRAISDGAYQAALYDIAVLPAYQGKEIGSLIIHELHKGLRDFTVILYARPGVEAFYKQFGYSRMLTGMARFEGEGEMRTRGFIE